MILTGLESMTGANPLEMEFADGALSIDLGKCSLRLLSPPVWI